jgi:hypothetical protein
MDSKASYDSEEIKDKVFTPTPYQEDNGNNPFDLTYERESQQ